VAGPLSRLWWLRRKISLLGRSRERGQGAGTGTGTGAGSGLVGLVFLG
jgi:hypothetical protein